MSEGGEETYTASEAARILKVSPHRVRQMLNTGDLEGQRDTESGRWKVPKRDVHALLEERHRQDRGRRGGEENPQDDPESVQELLERVEELSYRLGVSESRLELTELSESTARADRERLLAELEAEREERRRERERAEHLEANLRYALRPWWKRLFGRD